MRNFMMYSTLLVRYDYGYQLKEGETAGAFAVLVGEPGRKRPPGRPRSR